MPSSHVEPFLQWRVGTWGQVIGSRDLAADVAAAEAEAGVPGAGRGLLWAEVVVTMVATNMRLVRDFMVMR